MIEPVPYIVLGVYKPGLFEANLMGPELVEFSRRLSLHPYGGPWCGGAWYDIEASAELRLSVDTRANFFGDGWHRDGGLDQGIIAWANQDPTELRFNGRIYQAQPFEIVLFRNSGPEHRQPRKEMDGRWFYRQYVQPTHPIFDLLARGAVPEPPIYQAMRAISDDYFVDHDHNTEVK